MRRPPGAGDWGLGTGDWRPHRTPATTRMPTTIMSAPATRATINPKGPIFSTRTNAVSAATHIRFMTPTKVGPALECLSAHPQPVRRRRRDAQHLVLDSEGES